MDKPIIFLDFDGVINTPIWREYNRNKEHPNGIFRCDYAFPEDGFVNNFQAMCWLNELYSKIKYDIVVSSTWRNCCGKSKHKDVKDRLELDEILYNSGLNKEIKIIGKTPSCEYIQGATRGNEIKKWINDNNFSGKFIILDDDSDMGDLIDNLVKCDTYFGFGIMEFQKAKEMLGENSD